MHEGRAAAAGRLAQHADPVASSASQRSPHSEYWRVSPLGSTRSMCDPGAQSGSRSPSGCGQVELTTPSACTSLAVTRSVA